ncbi:MAG: ECF transporter S component [Oscillospiraceae bacterium]|nr:ECF transporter S component [Oscillospiraceae bacterium]
MKQNKKFSVYDLCVIGLMAALVFVATNFRIKIPVGGDSTMLHLGNVMCLLSGLLFGGLPGGLAAGFGSAIFDLTSEFASEAWITFINKFAMGFVAGAVAHCSKKLLPGQKANTILGAVLGSVTYVILYVTKTIFTQRFLYGAEWPVVFTVAGTKGLVSFVNGLIAVVASLLLVFALRPALQKAGLFEKLTVGKLKKTTAVPQAEATQTENK